MITKLIFSSLLAILFSTGILLDDSNSKGDESKLSSVQNEQIVRAIHHNGEVMPYISLPTVEITGKINTDVLVKATIVDGEIVPIIELEEIVITPNSGLKTI